MVYGEPHLRIYETGQIEELEREILYSDPNNPEKEAEIEEQNKRIIEDLKGKGLY
jgi:hypothetical protein